MSAIPYNLKNKSSVQGFIALMSVLIISLTLLGVSFTRSSNGFFSRFGILDSEYKRVGLGLAESCVNTSLLKIAQNYNYNYLTDPAYNATKGGVVVSINPSGTPPTECIIKSVVFGAEDSNHQKVATITTQGQYNNTWSNMKVSAIVQNPSYALIVRGTITVVVHVTNDNGGINQAGDFSVSVSPAVLNPSPTPFTGSETGSLVYINAGTYSITSTNISGYTQSVDAGCSGTIAAGENKVCTITENDIPTKGTLTLIANVVNDNGGTKQPSNFYLYIDSVLVSSGVPVANLSVGAHVVKADPMVGYTASTWGYHCATGGGISLNAGDNKTCIITFNDDPPPAPECVNTVMMLDRTGSMFGYPNYPSGYSQWIPDEQEAGRSMLDLFKTLSPNPRVGVGRFGDPTGQSADIIGQLTSTYGSRAVSGQGIGPQFPTVSVAPLIWVSPNNALTNDATFATSATNGQQQSYGNFGLSVPTGATITGIEVYVDGKVSGSSTANITTTPSSGGNYSSWDTGNSSDINEGIPSADCSSNDSLIDNDNNDRSSFTVSLSGVPNGATITSINVLAADRGDSSSGGQYATFVRFNGSNSANSSTYTVSGTSGSCTGNRTNVFDVTDTVKSGSTSLEVGVMKIGGTRVRVGAISAVVNYTTGASGTVSVQLWNKTSNSWTSSKSAALSTTESSVPVSNNSDTWSKTWNPSDFSDTNFILRVQNNSTTGIVTSLNYTTVKVYYNSPSTGLYAAIDNNLTDIGSYTNLGDAIKVGTAELNSVRADSTKKNVLILVSDGLNVNRPCSGNCGAVSTVSAQNWAITQANTAKNASKPTQIFIMHFGAKTESGNGVPACTGLCLLQQLVSPSTIPVSSITATGAKRSGTNVTITTASSHGISINQRVIISGITGSGSCNTLNGTYAINTTTSNTFTYTSSSSGTLNCGNGTVTATNLFEAPTSTEMPTVFNAIGKQACPAIGGAASTPPPTTANLIIITNVVNDNGGTSNAGTFTSLLTALNPSPSGNPTGISSPGINIIVDPGSYTVDQTAVSGYAKSLGVNCSGVIAAGETKTCTITNDDIQVSTATQITPPPLTNIIINTWQESTTGP